jgi:hypothetical protein
MQHRPCLVPEDCAPYEVQERYGRSSICWLWPTSSGTYHSPGPVVLAVGVTLRLDAGSHIITLQYLHSLYCSLFVRDLRVRYYFHHIR